MEERGYMYMPVDNTQTSHNTMSRRNITTQMQGYVNRLV